MTAPRTPDTPATVLRIVPSHKHGGGSQPPASPVGEAIDAICRARGISATHLARRLGLSQSYGSRLRHGSRPLSLPMVERFRRLDLTPDELRALLVAGGYGVDGTAAMSDPEIDALDALLHDRRVPDALRGFVREAVAGLVLAARKAAG